MNNVFCTCLVILAGCLFAVSWAACPYTECSCSGVQISCQNRNLTSVPALRTGNDSTGYTVLNLSGNKITRIRAGSLPPGLSQILLDHTPVSDIDSSALDGSAATLRKLSFTGANFTKIPDALGHLDGLEYLTIYDSTILDWNDQAMSHLGQTVTTLYLQNVGFKSWPKWLHNFTQVHQLSLLDGTVPGAPDDSLDNLSKINLLSITHCELTSIPKTVSNLKSLQLLQLLQNNITNITWLPQSGVLSSLNLNTNSLSDPVHIGNALRPLADTLKYINLKQNKLVEIPDLSFMSNLGDLDLSYNLINDSVSGVMPGSLYTLMLTGNFLQVIPRIFWKTPSLTYMQLGHNFITTIQDTDFPLSITEVNLENNLIQELSNSSFPENASIVFLDLSGNPISRIDLLAFSNLQRLVHINLHQTKLTRLPVALGTLTHLKLLDVRYNTDLVCTCSEKGLKPWIKGLLTLAGDCGVSSVQEFYSKLVDDCPP